jgi:diadenosine tetraphosphate (Ap4A) HIT family hydrolase
MRVLEKKRGKYIKRKKIQCDFCDLTVIKDQQVKKLEGKYWYVLASKFPYLDGNLMIITKRHIPDTTDLTQAEKEEFFMILEKTKKVLTKLFKTRSFNIGLNLGPDSGASIPHLHWQVIPRVKINPAVFNVINDLWFVTLDYKELIKKINK